jgi:hypothetical protein
MHIPVTGFWKSVPSASGMPILAASAVKASIETKTNWASPPRSSSRRYPIRSKGCVTFAAWSMS